MTRRDQPRLTAPSSPPTVVEIETGEAQAYLRELSAKVCAGDERALPHNLFAEIMRRVKIKPTGARR